MWFRVIYQLFFSVVWTKTFWCFTWFMYGWNIGPPQNSLRTASLWWFFNFLNVFFWYICSLFENKDSSLIRVVSICLFVILYCCYFWFGKRVAGGSNVAKREKYRESLNQSMLPKNNSGLESETVLLYRLVLL